MPATQVTALATALCNVEDLSYYMGLLNPTDMEKVNMQRIINAATTRVEKFCRRPFLARTIVEIQEGKGYTRLYLRAHPVVSVTSVEYLNWDGTTFKSYTGSELVVDLAKGLIRLTNGSSFVEGVDNWKVTYSASYAAIANVPDDVVLAMLALAKKWYSDHTSRKDDIQSQTIDGQTVFFNQDEIPPKIAGILKPYRLPVGMGT